VNLRYSCERFDVFIITGAYVTTATTSNNNQKNSNNEMNRNIFTGLGQYLPAVIGDLSNSLLFRLSKLPALDQINPN